MSAKPRIGFIGIGFMGHGMAGRILGKGYPLTVMAHRKRELVDDLVKRGAAEAKTPAELAKASDIVFLCVTASPQVEEIVRGADGLKAGGRKGLIIVDCSTANPVSTVALAAELAPLGIALADAPLGGTPSNAADGTLSSMVGASPEVFETIKPVVECFAAKVVHLGPPGFGHKMKLLNNFLSMGYAAIYSEALAMGAKSGIGAELFDSVVRGGRMDCGFYQTFFTYVLKRDRNAHKFTLANALKDARYIEAMANDAGVANTIGAAVKNSFAAAVNAGMAEDYVPMLSDFVRKANGA
jgi:3-hydroxyisobutyrate dehydrogenase-like beta-hydroxyacid dehydrogenase